MAVMWSVIFYTVLAVGAFYFILLRPVLKDQKAQKKAVQMLQIGDEVVTTGGLIGELKDVVTPADGPTELIIEIAPGHEGPSDAASAQQALPTGVPLRRLRFGVFRSRKRRFGMGGEVLGQRRDRGQPEQVDDRDGARGEALPQARVNLH